MVYYCVGFPLTDQHKQAKMKKEKRKKKSFNDTCGPEDGHESPPLPSKNGAELKYWIDNLLPQIDTAASQHDKTQIVAQMLLQLPRVTKDLKKTVHEVINLASSASSSPPFLTSCPPISVSLPQVIPSSSSSADKYRSSPTPHHHSPPCNSNSIVGRRSPPSPFEFYSLAFGEDQTEGRGSKGDDDGGTGGKPKGDNDNTDEKEKEKEREGGDRRVVPKAVRPQRGDSSLPGVPYQEAMLFSDNNNNNHNNLQLGPPLRRGVSMPLPRVNSSDRDGPSAFTYTTSGEGQHRPQRNSFNNHHHHHRHHNTGHIPGLEHSKKFAKGITREASQVVFKTLNKVIDKINENAEEYIESVEAEHLGELAEDIEGHDGDPTRTARTAKVLHKVLGGIKDDIGDKLKPGVQKRLLDQMAAIHAETSAIIAAQKEAHLYWSQRAQTLEQKVEKLSVQFGIVLLFVVLGLLWTMF